MAVDEHRRYIIWIEFPESLNDHIGRFQFVSRVYFFFRHPSCDRDFTVKIICVSCSKAWYSNSGLRESRSVSGMSVNDRADAGKSLEQTSMRRSIRRGA